MNNANLASSFIVVSRKIWKTLWIYYYINDFLSISSEICNEILQILMKKRFIYQFCK